jgi:hypothetical protein
MQTAIFLQLPLLSTLKGFGFNNEDGCCITAHIEQLVKLMQPTKTDEQLLSINDISKEVYTIVDKHLLTEARFAPIIKTPEALALCVSNLTGLLIQSVDAGRGLLSNTLLHFLCNEQFPRDNHYLQKSVVETLRFDSPIHNTRRVATARYYCR